MKDMIVGKFSIRNIVTLWSFEIALVKEKGRFMADFAAILPIFLIPLHYAHVWARVTSRP